ncbi:MAG: right-handed parallel beta-helix repeat-containing protein [Deltaproteobacteria bacterium]|nr:right-handed parallel beta-helix repeat-containing protein [Deltaproteobacteria bacterium]
MKKIASGIISLMIFAEFSCAGSPESPVIIDAGQQGCVAENEICGDGVDQDCNGSDLLCDNPDKDRDGFSYNDCDEGNRRVYPGVTVSCDTACGKGAQVCQEDGQFSACSCAVVCEAKSGAKCYYVSRLSGADNNSGAYNAPWKSLKNFISYESEAAKPSTWVNLQPGDVVYLLSGEYGLNEAVLNLSRQQGTTERPIIVKAYPAHRPIIGQNGASDNQPKYGANLIQSSNIVLDGLEFVYSRDFAVYVAESSNIEIRNCLLHDTWGNSADNLAGVHVVDSSSIRVHHNIIYDNYDRDKKWASGSGVILFGGGANRVDHNVIFMSARVPSDFETTGILYKHSASGGDVGFEADHNIIRNARLTSIGTGSVNSRVHHNLIIDSAMLESADFGGYTLTQNISFTNNTIINGLALNYRPTSEYGSFGLLTFGENIVVDNSAYSGERGLVVISEYGDETLYQAIMHNNGRLDFKDNCYYNPNYSVKIRAFAGNPAGTGDVYSLSAWQDAGYDSGSQEIDPQLNEFYRPTNNACSDKGWLAM